MFPLSSRFLTLLVVALSFCCCNAAFKFIKCTEKNCPEGAEVLDMYWVRHGFSCANLLKVWGMNQLDINTLAPDPALTELGLMQAHMAGKVFFDHVKEWRPDFYLVSQMKRAIETATYFMPEPLPDTDDTRLFVSPFISEYAYRLFGKQLTKDNEPAPAKEQIPYFCQDKTVRYPKGVTPTKNVTPRMLSNLKKKTPPVRCTAKDQFNGEQVTHNPVEFDFSFYHDDSKNDAKAFFKRYLPFFLSHHDKVPRHIKGETSFVVVSHSHYIQVLLGLYDQHDRPPATYLENCGIVRMRLLLHAASEGSCFQIYYKEVPELIYSGHPSSVQTQTNKPNYCYQTKLDPKKEYDKKPSQAFYPKNLEDYSALKHKKQKWWDDAFAQGLPLSANSASRCNALPPTAKLERLKRVTAGTPSSRGLVPATCLRPPALRSDLLPAAPESGVMEGYAVVNKKLTYLRVAIDSDADTLRVAQAAQPSASQEEAMLEVRVPEDSLDRFTLSEVEYVAISKEEDVLRLELFVGDNEKPLLVLSALPKKTWLSLCDNQLYYYWPYKLSVSPLSACNTLFTWKQFFEEHGVKKRGSIPGLLKVEDDEEDVDMQLSPTAITSPDFNWDEVTDGSVPDELQLEEDDFMFSVHNFPSFDDVLPKTKKVQLEDIDVVDKEKQKEMQITVTNEDGELVQTSSEKAKEKPEEAEKELDLLTMTPEEEREYMRLLDSGGRPRGGRSCMRGLPDDSFFPDNEEEREKIEQLD
eukprot:gnl/Spiro4/6215_TR3195_c0_g1_i1.p1 gnl/Spiro4/6215_TR3195_c0_g1~~gnl/Spiro4/6215_TR3195_c0_g1_i1.p1  ORF type:complete len:762 (+),score=233.98 gnl/Spiro4/6215_TR3195_c0_g1_i1:42-2288(+)